MKEDIKINIDLNNKLSMDHKPTFWTFLRDSWDLYSDHKALMSFICYKIQDPCKGLRPAKRRFLFENGISTKSTYIAGVVQEYKWLKEILNEILPDDGINVEEYPIKLKEKLDEIMANSYQKNVK